MMHSSTPIALVGDVIQISNMEMLLDNKMMHSSTPITLVGDVIQISNMEMLLNHSNNLLDRHPNNNGDLLFDNIIKYNNKQTLLISQKLETTLQSVKTDIGQLASSLSQLQSQGSSQMPSQTIPNPKGNEDIDHAVNVRDSIDSMGYDDFVLQDCAKIS
ncbi:hypothetical protein L195_g044606, partial [Trifolium pratense]